MEFDAETGNIVHQHTNEKAGVLGIMQIGLLQVILCTRSQNKVQTRYWAGVG